MFFIVSCFLYPFPPLFSLFFLLFFSLLPLFFNTLFIDCACMCVPAHICECTYVYYKEQYDIKRREVFNTVKFEIKMKLSS